MSRTDRIAGMASDDSARRVDLLQGDGERGGRTIEAARDTTVTKVASRFSPRGAMGQRYLASGVHLSMRLWDEAVGPEQRAVVRDYETVGFCISGCAELWLEGQKILLEPGDSWVVPRGATHAYRILEAFRAVEATAPPASAHGRDEVSRPLSRG